MKPNLTGKAYDQITHRWARDTFNNENGIDQHERAIAFVESYGIALDVGCGCNSRYLECLTSKGFVYEGLDVSEEMISLARKQNPDVVFHHADICKWHNTQKYDFISAWDSIWHVPLDKQTSVLSKLIASLNAGGVFVFSCGGTSSPNEHIDDAMGVDVYYSSLGVNETLKLCLSAGCICRHVEYIQYPELHTYFIFEMT